MYELVFATQRMGMAALVRLPDQLGTPVQPLLTGSTPLYFYFGGTPSTTLPAGQSGSLVLACVSFLRCWP